VSRYHRPLCVFRLLLCVSKVAGVIHQASRHIIAKNSSAQKLHGIHTVDDGIEIADFKCLRGHDVMGLSVLTEF
jgi:hypothetical protein